MIGMKTQFLFFILVLFQAAHSVEEYLTGLFRWFPRATGKIHEFIDIIPVMSMRETVFAALNVVFVIFLVVVSVLVFRRNRWAWKIMRLVAVIEIINGLVHILAAVFTGEYFPGAVSAIGLLVTGLLLLVTCKPLPSQS